MAAVAAIREGSGARVKPDEGYLGPSTVPPEALATAESTSAAPAPRLAVTPPPEHVQARRMANPGLRPIAEREAQREAEQRLAKQAAEAFATQAPRDVAVDLAHERPLPPLVWPETEDTSC
jgi:hypothetical protein